MPFDGLEPRDGLDHRVRNGDFENGQSTEQLHCLFPVLVADLFPLDLRNPLGRGIGRKVRKRPAMYISNTDVLGLHHLVFEVMDNSIDEVMAGFCTKIDVVLHADNSITIVDNDRGIPVGPHPSNRKISTVEVVMTKLHAGGKFDNEAYRFSAGLHGVGVSVVNFLTEWLEVEVKQEGGVYFQRYELGLPQGRFIEALLSFNVGVELGQITVLACAFSIVGWFRKRAWYRARIVVPASGVITIVALYWTLTRWMG